MKKDLTILLWMIIIGLLLMTGLMFEMGCARIGDQIATYCKCDSMVKK